MGVDGLTVTEARSLKKNQSIRRATLLLKPGGDSLLVSGGLPAVSTAASRPSCPYVLLSLRFCLHVRCLPLGCYIKHHRLSDFGSHLLLIVVEVRSPRSRCGHIESLVVSPLPGSQVVGGLSERSSASFTRLLNTCPRPRLHISPPWGLFQHGNLGGDTSIPSIA